MTDSSEPSSEDLPSELMGTFRLAADGRIRREVAMARLDDVTHRFAREARRAGISPEQMLVVLKRCLTASRLRLRRVDFPRVRERLVSVAIEAYYANGEDI